MTSVYSLCNGVVVSILSQDDTYIISIQYDALTVLRYKNIKNCNTALGSIVKTGQLIGDIEDELKLDYCKADSADTRYPVRINRRTYYKVDPDLIMSGKVALPSSILSMVKINNSNDPPHIVLTESQLLEYSSSRRQVSVQL